MGNFIKENKIKLLGVVIILYCVLIMWVLPMNENLTPQITQIEKKLYSGENVSEIASGISFLGDNLDRVDSVYIDGRKNDDCQVTYCDMNKVVIIIPKEIYQDKDSFSIQVSKKWGGIYTFKGKKYRVLLDKSLIDAPQIVSVSTDIIYRSQGNQRIIIKGENLTEESKLYVNGIETAVIFDNSSNSVVTSISPDMYSERDDIELQFGVALSEMQTLCGNMVKINVANIDYKKYKHSYDFAKDNMFIMHAAGEWAGYTYTNCMEAFLSNYEKGCRMFEIDLMVTSDGVIVGRHDWSTVMFGKGLIAENELLLESYKRNNLPKTYDELCNMYEGRTPLTWENILDYLSSDDELYIVTDTKYYNDEAIEYVFGKMVAIAKQGKKEDVLDRVVVQVYNQDMYRKVMEIYPFASIIYTLYQSEDSNEEVLEFIDNSNVRVITLPKESYRDDDAFFQELIKRGCYIYVHTVNDIPIAASYIARGCSGIYTDIIRPENMSELNAQIKKTKETALYDSLTEDIEKTDIEFNKKYLLNYINEINDENYLVLMTIQDEATLGVDDEIADALASIGVSPNYRYAFRKSYIGVVSGGKTIYEKFSEDLLEYTYFDGENLYELVSAGNGAPGTTSIMVNGVEQIVSPSRGLYIVVFNKKLGIVQDRVVFDLYDGLNYTNY